METRRTWIENALFAIYCYRQGNRLESFAHLENPVHGIPRRHEFARFAAHVETLRRGGTSFFTAAHQTTRHDAYLRHCAELADGNFIQQLAREISSIPITGKGIDLRRVFGILKRLPNNGDFFAWQMTCDLVESRCLGDNVDWNSFCVLGPGAKDGLKRIFGSVNCAKHGFLELSRLFCSLQSYIFETLIGTPFPSWRGQPLTLKEIEHALCEYSKLERIMASKGQGMLVRQRLFKSRVALDHQKSCFLCGAEACLCQSSPGSRCDTCHLAYCASCVPLACSKASEDRSPPSVAGWTCRRCEVFDTVSFVG